MEAGEIGGVREGGRESVEERKKCTCMFMGSVCLCGWVGGSERGRGCREGGSQ